MGPFWPQLDLAWPLPSVPMERGLPPVNLRASLTIGYSLCKAIPKLLPSEAHLCPLKCKIRTDHALLPGCNSLAPGTSSSSTSCLSHYQPCRLCFLPSPPPEVNPGALEGPCMTLPPESLRCFISFSQLLGMWWSGAPSTQRASAAKATTEIENHHLNRVSTTWQLPLLSRSSWFSR